MAQSDYISNLLFLLSLAGKGGTLASDAPAAGKALAGAQLAGGGVKAGQLLGAVPKNAALSNLLRALGLAATGYNVYNIATSDATARRKALESAKALAQLVPVWGQLFALQQLGVGLTRKAQGSSSPQVRGFAKGSEALLQPSAATSLESVIAGEQSPKEALKAGGGIGGLALGVLDPVTTAFTKALGIDPFHSKPTQGVQFRNQLQQILPQVGVKGSRFGAQAYNIDPAKFEAFTPEAKAAAQALGAAVAAFAPAGKKTPAYAIQAQNILLNNLGEGVIGVGPQILGKIGGQPIEILAKIRQSFPEMPAGDFRLIANWLTSQKLPAPAVPPKPQVRGGLPVSGLPPGGLSDALKNYLAQRQAA